MGTASAPLTLSGVIAAVAVHTIDAEHALATIAASLRLKAVGVSPVLGIAQQRLELGFKSTRIHVP